MKVKISPMGKMHADIEVDQATGDIVVTPHRYTKSQKVVPILSFETKLADGTLVERGVLSMHARTGRMKVERTMEEVGFDVESA